ncbi:Apolipoprotein L3 [Labeo rohita]|uniref:Apolipoprotein L3 n=1 Tax=Labeo rohita TaxID=84645 RepID=A0ABQ8L6B7_LABRO|nr:Apolipoprotein L3 [Labeo rohita]
MHKKTTEGSLTGAALGAAGGIASIAGLSLAPSLAFTGAGAAVGIVGGATSATYTITNMIEAKNLHETIEKIIKYVQNTISAIIEQLREIYDNIEETEQLEETMEKESVTTAATDISEQKNEIGKVSALAVKGMLVFVQAANVAVDAAEAAFVAAWAAKVARVSANAAKFGGRATGILSAVFVVFDVVSVVQHATEISEINQPADNRNQENIKSDTLKFIRMPDIPPCDFWVFWTHYRNVGDSCSFWEKWFV